MKEADSHQPPPYLECNGPQSPLFNNTLMGPAGNTVENNLYLWRIRAKREAMRRHGEKWSVDHDRTMVKLLYHWDVINHQQLQEELRLISRTINSRCLSTPGLGKLRFY